MTPMWRNWLYAQHLKCCGRKAMWVRVPPSAQMGATPTKLVNHDFFKTWTPEMSYVFGYFIADGCISISKDRIKNPYTFNITSADEEHLYKMRDVLGSTHKISNKNGHNKSPAFQIQIRSSVLANDLISLGVFPKKTYNLQKIYVPENYFWDFARGFFDGDGTVYIYNVNGVPQIKSGFVCASFPFIEDLNEKICSHLKIPLKNIHITPAKNKRIEKYSIDYYIEDSEKLITYFYSGSPALYLARKKEVFDRWLKIKKNKRQFTKNSYPSKVGWHLNKNLVN